MPTTTTDKPSAEMQPGEFVIYNDGREGHIDVRAVVLSVDSQGMMVSFEDRADVTRIQFNQPAWMNFLRREK